MTRLIENKVDKINLRSEVTFEGEIRLREVNYIGFCSFGVLDYIVSELYKKQVVWFYLYVTCGVI